MQNTVTIKNLGYLLCKASIWQKTPPNVAAYKLSMSKIRFFRDSNLESKHDLRFESESESESFLDALQQRQTSNKPFRLVHFLEFKNLIGIFDTLLGFPNFQFLFKW